MLELEAHILPVEDVGRREGHLSHVGQFEDDGYGKRSRSCKGAQVGWCGLVQVTKRRTLVENAASIRVGIPRVLPMTITITSTI